MLNQHMLKDLPFDLDRLHAAYAAGLSPVHVMDECFRRIAAVDDPGIFLQLNTLDAVRADAAALGDFDPAAMPLWGLPFAIKDNIDAADLVTTAACPAYAYTAQQDAFVVSVLRRAGAILIGKTNLDQFATGLVGVRSPYTPPKNAIDPNLVPGGSSSGSAVAVAHGLVSFALGTDTAGSGRVPAALNNIVGLKPSLGALSSTGVVPACRSLDTVSVFALTVDDAYRVFQIANIFDSSDPFATPVPAPPLAAVPGVFRVGVPDTASSVFGDQAQDNAFAAALDRLAALGGKIVPIDFTPMFRIADLLYQGAWLAERYLAVRPILQTQPESLLPVLRQIFSGAEAIPATSAFRDFHRLRDLLRQVQPLLDTVDLLCVPSVPAFATLKEVERDPIGANSRLGKYTNFVNLMDMCGITVPTSPRIDTLPGSVTLLGRRNQDAQLATIARALQHSCDAPLGTTAWHVSKSPLPVFASAPEEMTLAVVGAHMSGLPLNQELTRLGGRFIRKARTANCYKLFRLPGDPPVRPGLIRVKEGTAIELEVWALPRTGVGDFICKVPLPLCIGTVLLDDGQQVKGFLCESSAIDGAHDVSAYGGWRAYLNATSSSPQPT